MRLARLTSSSRRLPQEAAERAREGAGESRWRINAAEGTNPDRGRSLQEELEAGKAPFPDAPSGQAALREAREVAGKLVNMGSGAAALIKPQRPSVDTKA